MPVILTVQEIVNGFSIAIEPRGISRMSRTTSRSDAGSATCTGGTRGCAAALGPGDWGRVDMEVLVRARYGDAGRIGGVEG